MAELDPLDADAQAAAQLSDDAEAHDAEPSLQASALAVKDAAVVLGEQVGTAIAAAERALRKVASENPYLLLGGGVGSGFVAGGGLASPLTRVFVRTGLRTAGLFLLDAARKALTPETETATATTTSSIPPPVPLDDDEVAGPPTTAPWHP